MRAFLEAHEGLLFAERQGGRGIDEVSKDVVGFGVRVPVSHLRPKKPIEAARHRRQLEIAVDFHGHGRREGVHVKEVDSLGDVVLNDHPIRTAANERRGRAAELVRKQQRQFLMTQMQDGRLAERSFVPGQRDPLVENPRVLWRRLTPPIRFAAKPTGAPDRSRRGAGETGGARS